MRQRIVGNNCCRQGVVAACGGVVIFGVVIFGVVIVGVVIVKRFGKE
jgi:hypothetical protein